MEQIFSGTLSLPVPEDGCAVKIPSDILDVAGFVPGDVVRFEAVKEKIIISRNDVPQKATLESLFKDYEGLPFKTNLIDLGEPVGGEKW